MTMKRRDALKTIGGLAGAASMARLLPGCGGEGRSPSTTVYLMMENRTYDHLLGARALEGLPGDGQRPGFANPALDGRPVAAFAARSDRGSPMASVCDPDPPHSWLPSHRAFNGGAMDGFLREHQNSHGGDVAAIEPMKYLTREHVPITWALADAYTTCDRWFASVMGPTLPNRAYWHTGTSFGLDNNTAVLNAFASVPVPTIYHRLTERGVDWAYYFGNLAVVSLLAQPGPFQLDIGPNDGTGRVRRFGDANLGAGQFFKDAAAGTLPPVVYIDPSFGTNDDHPPAHPILGQELLAAVYTALARSPQWDNCMLVVVYDEHGGYFDHVPPPQTTDDTLARFGVDGFQQLGFRVPALVAGPYVKQGYVSSVQYDHTSALRHLQTTFGLDSLTARVDAANDLTDCIDLDRLARG
ncbi:MAG TPA: alkaline phosphatase family protein, partial [Kofleriaceae bacterium]|nr:alkaline phosphatase family protein [Kofleriaceae bacterium]